MLYTNPDSTINGNVSMPSAGWDMVGGGRRATRSSVA
jgi:hypothetical protein